jgi:hypothetical protein
MVQVVGIAHPTGANRGRAGLHKYWFSLPRFLFSKRKFSGCQGKPLGHDVAMAPVDKRGALPYILVFFVLLSFFQKKVRFFDMRALPASIFSVFGGPCPLRHAWCLR